MNKKGFGLVMIIIVVGIVAILAAGGTLLVGDKKGGSYIEERVGAIEQAEKVKTIVEDQNKDVRKLIEEQ